MILIITIFKFQIINNHFLFLCNIKKIIDDNTKKKVNNNDEYIDYKNEKPQKDNYQKKT